jgi:hypothetical protein
VTPPDLNPDLAVTVELNKLKAPAGAGAVVKLALAGG